MNVSHILYELDLLAFILNIPRGIGALKATSNRGLQPAMDHLVENEGKPIPDLSSVSETPSAGGAPPQGDEDDEDAEALRAIYGAAGASGVQAEAKVCSVAIIGIFKTLMWSFTYRA